MVFRPHAVIPESLYDIALCPMQEYVFILKSNRYETGLETSSGANPYHPDDLFLNLVTDSITIMASEVIREFWITASGVS